MRLKDYYKILDLPPNASLEDIRKSYRRLAKKYHPDLNAGDSLASAHFKEIKEAYENLTHPAKREIYHQHRWYQQSIARRFSDQTVLEPSALLREIHSLEQYVSTLDIYRLDQDGLSQYIQTLLSPENLTMLAQFNNPAINHQITILVLSVCKPLVFDKAKLIFQKLESIVSDDPELLNRIRNAILGKKRRAQWEKYKPFVVIAIVIALCLLIYFNGNAI